MQPTRLMLGFLRKGIPRPTGWDQGCVEFSRHPKSAGKQLERLPRSKLLTTRFSITAVLHVPGKYICTGLFVRNRVLRHLRAESPSLTARSAGLKIFSGVWGLVIFPACRRRLLKVGAGRGPSKRTDRSSGKDILSYEIALQKTRRGK
jgi:hypothetical protein